MKNTRATIDAPESCTASVHEAGAGAADIERILAHLLASARRHSRRSDEADDLLQEAICAAITADRFDLTEPANVRWLHGVIRNKAAGAARSAWRRRSRESAYASSRSVITTTHSEERPILPHLSPALETVARLALLGHNRKEIAYLLGISDTTLRQRIAALRRRIGRADEPAPDEFAALESPLAYGMIRAALLEPVHRTTAALGSHDADGHLFMVRSRHVLTKSQSPATGE